MGLSNLSFLLYNRDNNMFHKSNIINKIITVLYFLLLISCNNNSLRNEILNIPAKNFNSYEFNSNIPIRYLFSICKPNCSIYIHT